MLLATAGTVDAQTNTNGSFESTDLGVVTDLAAGVDGWSLEVAEALTEAPEFSIVDDAYEGDRALRVAVNATGENAYDIQATATPVNVTPGATYNVSVWAKSETAGGTAAFTVGNASFSEYAALRDGINLTTEWQQFTFSFTVTDQETVIRAPLHFSFTANVDNAVYIDALTIIDPDAPNPAAVPVIVEAESGTLGSDFSTASDDTDATYIEISTPLADTAYPGENRTATYEVTFPAAGTYDLFARVYVGPDGGGFDDDSFFYANEFGQRDATLGTDWVTANGLASAGYSEEDNVVRGPGAEGVELWKWVNLSDFGLDAPDIPADSFMVAEGALTQTFQIGAREDGLRIDKLAFGLSTYFYTVDNLENGEEGSPTNPDDGGFEPSGPPLAEGANRFLGNVYSNAQRPDYEFYWNQVTPENAGKWGAVESTRDQMNWGALDTAYNLAKENGWPFRFHILIWGNQQPTWMADLSEEEQLAEINEWFAAVAERYEDIDYLEVVNEPLHDPPSCDHPNNQGDNCASSGDYLDALGGSGETGWDWIVTSFRLARQYFPDTPLMINDYGILSSTTEARRYREIVEILQEEDLIDLVGVQGHAFSTRTGAPITAVLDILAGTGLPLMVTEFDVDGNPNESAFVTEEQSDANQLRDMQRIFPQLWQHPAMVGVTLWGWRPGHWRTAQDAFLVRDNGEERPALVWLRQYVSENLSVASEGGPSSTIASLGSAPNPFSRTTRVEYSLAEASEVSLQVFDVTGRVVATLATGQRTAGEHTETFDASGLASGFYIVQLRAGDEVQTGRVILTR